MASIRSLLFEVPTNDTFQFTGYGDRTLDMTIYDRGVSNRTIPNPSLHRGMVPIMEDLSPTIFACLC